MIKLIICDIGGVIEDFSERMYIDYICKKLGINRNAFRDEFIPMLQKAELGSKSTPDMLNRLAKKFSVKAQDLHFSTSLARLARLDNKVVDIVNRLHRNYKLVLLTNVSISRYLANERIGLFKKVKHDRVFASCYLKMSKPYPKIYRYTLKAMKMRPEEALFIDDRIENVKGAQRVGIKAIRFRNHVQLAADLRKAGVKW